MKKTTISINVVRRLPRYLRALNELAEEGRERISSSELGKMLGLTPSQIRQDFSAYGEFGQQGYGYNICSLRDELNRILGTDRNYSVILIGAGKLGQVLVENFNQVAKGYELIGAFDADYNLIGRKLSECSIYDIRQLEEFVQENQADIAILSVPMDSAQALTDLLVQVGIPAIWNFTNVEIDVGKSGVLVENIHFADSFLTLSYFLTDKKRTAEQSNKHERESAGDMPGRSYLLPADRKGKG